MLGVIEQTCWTCSDLIDWGKVEKAHDYKQPAPIVLMHFFFFSLTLYWCKTGVKHEARGPESAWQKAPIQSAGHLQLVLLKKTSLTTVHFTQVIIKWQDFLFFPPSPSKSESSFFYNVSIIKKSINGTFFLIIKTFLLYIYRTVWAISNHNFCNFTHFLQLKPKESCWLIYFVKQSCISLSCCKTETLLKLHSFSLYWDNTGIKCMVKLIYSFHSWHY